MGKWDTVTLPDGFKEKLEILRNTPMEDVMRLWVEIDAPPLGLYGLEWYRGSSGGGWMCIDDSRTTKVFKMFIDDNKMPSHQSYFEQMACVLAHQVGMKQWTPPTASNADMKVIREIDEVSQRQVLINYLQAASRVANLNKGNFLSESEKSNIVNDIKKTLNTIRHGEEIPTSN